MIVRIRLEPLGATLEAASGTPLTELLFAHGVEFPCGGRGSCRRCRVRVISGGAPATDEERRLLGAADVAAGWRLACRTSTLDDTVLEIEQWETTVLADDTQVSGRPREGLGLAVDVGTTTLVAQLLDLRTSRVLGVRSALNPQAAHGADIMTRVQVALTPGGALRLRDVVRAEIGRMAGELVDRRAAERVRVTLVGNTVMHHLFCGLDVAPLAEAPFETPSSGLVRFTAGDLGWSLPSPTEVSFLPGLGSFVGSDVLAGIRATRLLESDRLVALLDLGTNGEIVVGSRDGLLCASAAAGPAFEGGRISWGMRAATGAICEVTVAAQAMRARVLGGTRPRGLCGSGLVDAVRCARDLGLIEPSGRIANGARAVPVAGPVSLTQADVREVQLAKAAIAAGVRVLLGRLGASPGGVSRVFLAGAFGNYISRESAVRIGLLAFDPARVEPIGNAALIGAKLALFDDDEAENDRVRARVTHVPLGADEQFQEAFVEGMRLA